MSSPAPLLRPLTLQPGLAASTFSKRGGKEGETDQLY